MLLPASGLKGLKATSKLRVFDSQLIHLSMHPLDGCDGSAGEVERGDVFVVPAKAERGVKVLRHGSHMLDGGGVDRFPRADRQLE